MASNGRDRMMQSQRATATDQALVAGFLKAAWSEAWPPVCKRPVRKVGADRIAGARKAAAGLAG